MEANTTIETQMNYAKESPLFYKVFTLAGIGIFLDAADVYMASAINTAMMNDKFATVAQGSMFLSAGFLGLFVGSLLAGYIGDFYGRRRSYQFNLLLFGVFTFISAFMPSVTWMIICRFFAAVGLGAEIVTGYAVVNEFAPVNRRGFWSGMIAIVANAGAPITLLVATFMVPNVGWRSMFIVMGIAAIILWFARHNFPESPRWLIARGREKEAQAIVDQLNVNGMYDITEKNEDERRVKVSFGRGVFVASVAVGAALLCQYTFTSWVPTLLVRRGISIFSSIGFSAVMMLGAPIGATIGTVLVERTGRKKLIVTTFLATAILGIAYAYETTTVGTIINGMLLTTTFYILMASVISVYTNELFETKYRFRGAGIANAVAKLLNVLMPTVVAFLITQVSPSAIFYGIAGMAVIAAAVVGFFGPETTAKEIK
ncbi:MFS transporter [Lacticaseibacillus baoqingensis]|uniref:MFS transporter n=1 Tax=Lacticaseibacillus baoqingensis TaxID=2486013 RepID=A0ABW4E4N9_9LACO|nr:MFS transporter [Lacticaseibacillus baoqingensis]